MMSNDQRAERYLRDRSTLTPAQRRRIRHHDNAEAADIGRTAMRGAKREAAKLERSRLAQIRLRFHLARHR